MQFYKYKTALMQFLEFFLEFNSYFYCIYKENNDIFIRGGNNIIKVHCR